MNRILIIEDDAVARRQLSDLFRFEDFDVVEAECGQAGIAAGLELKPDLVVCDIMMPGTDGFAVLNALRRNSETCLTPFIFLTAKAGSQDVRSGMSEGADDYITKPYNPDALLASVRQRLWRRELQMQDAERRAANAGMMAAAALPREVEGCLSRLETAVHLLTHCCDAGSESAKVDGVIRQDFDLLRRLCRRLRLYGDLPGLYARRFAQAADVTIEVSPQILLDSAKAVARRWSRDSDLDISVVPGKASISAEVLRTVLEELVDNACKFSPHGAPITIDAGSEQAYWRVTVTDRGLGMLPEQIRGIGAFKQFWSGPERPEGLGLGLVLVQGLARMHSGEVLIESEPGVGTRVTVMVPSE